jgi:hypothetical protein
MSPSTRTQKPSQPKERKVETAATETQEIQRETGALVDQARSLIVKSPAQYEEAGRIVIAIRRVRKSIADTFGPIKKKAHAAWLEVLAQEKKHDTPLEAAERQLSGIMGNFQAEVEAERQRIAREEAKRREEEQRAAQAKADEERAAQLRLDEDARLAHAAALEAEGKHAEANAVLDAPPPPPPPPAPPAAPAPVAAMPEAPKADGVSFRQNWKARVVDLQLLLEAVASGRQPLTMIEANQKALDGIAKALKGEARIPGVEFFSETVSSVRA